MLIERVELINELLVVIETQELLHLLDLLDFLFLTSNLLFHLFHYPLIVGHFLLQVIFLHSAFLFILRMDNCALQRIFGFMLLINKRLKPIFKLEQQ